MDSTPRLMKVIEAANQKEPKSASKIASMGVKGETYLVARAQSNDRRRAPTSAVAVASNQKVGSSWWALRKAVSPYESVLVF
jgi:hypothetical protein